MRIAVLRGGPSLDYEQSLESGAVALGHLRECHEVQEIFIDKEGTWHRAGVPVSPERLAPHFDIFFNALHGDFGESGDAQHIMDNLGVAYTGSGSLASRGAYNKHLAKRILSDAGVSVPMGAIITNDTDPVAASDEIFARMGGQYVVKPVTGGGGRGVQIVRSQQDLASALTRGLLDWGEVLVEERLQGREVKVAVIEGFRGQDFYTLLPIESDSFICPARLSPDEKYEAMRLAVKAYQILGLSGYSTVDMILTKKGFVLIELDALPPLAPNYHLYRSLEAVGASMGELLNHVVRSA